MLVGITAALLAAVPAIADPSDVQHKQAEAQSVLSQVQQLDSQLGTAIERWNLANVKLEKIRGSLKENARELTIARGGLKLGQRRIAKRLVALYTTGDDGGTLEVLLGARSLDDLLDRIDTASRVSNLDTRVVREVKTFKHATAKHKQLLAAARAAQERVVAQRSAEKSSIQSQLAQRKRLLASIKDEIARLQAQERARQAELARRARARIAAEAAARQAASDPNPAVGILAEDADDPAPPPPPPSQYGGVVGIAMSYLGVPYVWGGSTPSGFDCSGFTSYVYAQVGVSLPHSSYAQYGYGTPVSKDELEPGDLVFFDGLGHVGIYIGGGQFIQAPHTGDVVKISSLGDGSYSASYVGARRL